MCNNINLRDKIIDLNTRETCRKTLPVFYGSNDNYEHGLKEVIGNSVDEINNNFETGTIIVELFDDLRTISVIDTGRGIPIDEESNGKPNYVLLFETLFAGTNYNNAKNKKITIGTNGVGTCVLNHTSDLFLVEVCRNKKITELRYENGGEFISINEIGKGRDTYTKITFRLSEEVYTNVVYNPDSIRYICNNFSATNEKINIIFKHKGDETEYHYDNLLDFFIKNSKDNTTSILTHLPKTYESEYIEKIKEKDEIKIETIIEETTVDLLLAGTNSKEQFQATFLNGIYLSERGTIYDGVIAGVRAFIHKYLKENGLYNKKEKNISLKDVENSLNFLCTVKSTRVSFENQTKFSTKKELYKDKVQDYTTEYLEVFMAEQPLEMEKIAKQILTNKRVEEKTSEYINKAKKKLAEKVNNMDSRVKGFVDCKIHGEKSVLFITEGNSALGTIVAARDASFQAAYPLRGKLLNILKADYEQIFNNEEITDLIKIIGCGIEMKKKEYAMFDIEKIKYGKIVIATDQDNDGLHIQCLVLTFIYKLMPTLIKEGYVYILDTPLFEIRDLDSDKVHYAFSELEKNDILNSIKNYQVSRNKGLGEIDSETMAKCINNPKTVRRVKWGQAEEVIKWFEIFMGDNLFERKLYMEKKLPKYIENIKE